VFWNPSSDPRQPNVGFVEKTMNLLETLFAQNLYDVCLICHVYSDAEEEQLSELLKGLHGRCEVVYCETVPGKAHIVRHLEPSIHIESDVSVIEMLGSHVPLIIRIHNVGSTGKQAPKTSPKRSSFSEADKRLSSRSDSIEEIEKNLPRNVELATSLSTCSLFKPAKAH
jgi:hypothetical protein